MDIDMIKKKISSRIPPITANGIVYYQDVWGCTLFENLLACNLVESPYGVYDPFENPISLRRDTFFKKLGVYPTGGPLKVFRSCTFTESEIDELCAKIKELFDQGVANPVV